MKFHSQSSFSSVTETEVKTKSLQEIDEPWNIYIFNDPVNLMSYVVMVLRKVFGFNKQLANKIMLQAHNNGKALVWSGSRELAEAYLQQLHSFNIMGKMSKE